MADKSRVVVELEKFRKAKDKLSKYQRHDIYRGSAFPPMTIEPFPHERQRLAGMTDADRALRKQWLADQVLSPNEPRYIPEVDPQNVFRRAIRYPWDVLFKSLVPALGFKRAAIYRAIIPKMVAGVAVTYLIAYHLRHAPNTWETNSGWNITMTKKPVFSRSHPDTQEITQKESWEFYDRGFSKRKALLE